MGMKIVVLDGYAANPGDMSWQPLERLGRLTVYDRTKAEEVAERAAEAEAVLTNKTPIDAEALNRLPKLRYIGVLATGYNIVDIEAAAKRGIVVTNVPDYSSMSVAQLVFALILEHCHRVQRHADAVNAGEWAASPDFTFSKSPLVELAGKTIGIVGFGEIGRQTARLATAFGMNVMVHTRTERRVAGLEHVSYVTLEELLRRSDIVSLHCPLTPETKEMINRETIAMMKRTALLINTARGGHIAEADLAEALREGRIAGAGLDVLSVEPPAADHPLIGLDNCIVTPHIAWATREARARLIGMAAFNLERFIAGETVNRVN